VRQAQAAGLDHNGHGWQLVEETNPTTPGVHTGQKTKQQLRMGRTAILAGAANLKEKKNGDGNAWLRDSESYKSGALPRVLCTAYPCYVRVLCTCLCVPCPRVRVCQPACLARCCVPASACGACAGPLCACALHLFARAIPSSFIWMTCSNAVSF